MALYVLKVIASVLIVVGVTEVSRRAGIFWGGILASLPLTSLLAFLWLYSDSYKTDAIAALSWSIFWMVLPSLTFFALFPVFLKRGLSFPIALVLSLGVMAAAYFLTATLVRRFGIQI
jgi:hypothetical protein